MASLKMNPLRNSGQRIFHLRILMTCTLGVVAIVFGFGTYFGLAYSESQFASRQFRAVAENALLGMRESFDQFDLTYRTVSSMYSNYFPDESQWPYVTLPGFYDTLLGLSEYYNIAISFQPFVEPEPGADPRNQTNFEKYVFDHYAKEPFLPKFPPPGLPTPELGYGGIWSMSSTGAIYHDVTGEVFWGDSTNTLMPLVDNLFQPGSDTPFLFCANTHTTDFGPILDEVIDCTRQSTDVSQACKDCPRLKPWRYEALSDQLLGFPAYPITLQGNTSKIVGIISGSFDWKGLLDSVVPNYLGDIDVVIVTKGYNENDVLENDAIYTYTIVDGEPSFTGYGDMHDRRFSHMGSKNNLLQLYRTSSVDISLYPRQSFVEEYETSQPLWISMGSVLLIAFCSAVFAAYDYAVNRESVEQQIVLDTKRRFVRYISYEVRTPLNTVRLGLKLFELELLNMKKTAPKLSSVDELRDAIMGSLDSWIELTDDVLGNSEAAVDVLSDLLNYDKVETGTLRLEFSTVAIWNVTRDVFKAFGMQSQQKGVHMHMIESHDDESRSLATAADTPTSNATTGTVDEYDRMGVVGDSTRLAQVLRNLMSNALKFTPEGGDVTLQVKWLSNGDPTGNTKEAVDVPADQLDLLELPRCGAIRISVKDSGAGLSEDQLAQICKEGVQFNANKLQAGQGSELGLFISKGIIEQHGGTMTVTSDGLDKGSVFTITLPLYVVASASTSNILTSSAPVAQDIVDSHTITADKSDLEQTAASSPRSVQVLIVDDAMSNRKLLKRILVARGYLCEEAEDGAKGVAKYREMCSRDAPPDVILSDYEMPVMNGPDAVLEIRQLGCECFIVGITGNVMQADIDYFKEHGADAVLAKPLNTDTFESLFRQYQQNPSLIVQRRQNGSQSRTKDTIGVVSPRPLLTSKSTTALQAPRRIAVTSEGLESKSSDKVGRVDENERISWQAEV